MMSQIVDVSIVLCFHCQFGIICSSVQPGKTGQGIYPALDPNQGLYKGKHRMNGSLSLLTKSYENFDDIILG